MVRRILILCIIVLGAETTIAQNYQTVEEVDSACAQLGFMSDEAAQITVDDILDKVGLFRNFTIAQCPNINNAVAKNIDLGDGTKSRYILYDNAFFDRISDKANNDWAATSILAHEIGHHLNGHALNNQGSNHKWELEADEFSGFVLARMDASLEDAQSAISTLTYEKATRTHPAKADRLMAIKKGWNRGSTGTVVVDDNTDNSNAKVILNKYIEAIGGQENVANIKTLVLEINSKSIGEYNGAQVESVSSMNMTYLTPLIYNTVYKSDAFEAESLTIGNTNYTMTNGKYIKTESPNFGGDRITSYIPEYHYVINNTNFEAATTKEVDGQTYYVLEFPELKSNITNDAVNMEMLKKQYNYYNADTGLLDLAVFNFNTKTDYVTENEYLKDSETNTVTTNYYKDYQPVNGVLFPHSTIIKSAPAGSEPTGETIMTFTKIAANTNLNPDDFKLDEKRTVVTMEENSNNMMESLAEFQEAVKLITSGQCEAGIEKLKSGAEKGNTQAQIMLAQIYDNSYFYCTKALKKDETKALYWYEKASVDPLSGNEALIKLADGYAKGKLGLSKDKSKALQLYLVSSRSLMFSFVNPKVFKAISSLKKSGDLSDADFVYIDALEKMKKGNKTESFKLLTQAAEAGSTHAQVALAQALMMKGDVKGQNEWLKKAADQGDEQAKRKLKRGF